MGRGLAVCAGERYSGRVTPSRRRDVVQVLIPERLASKARRNQRGAELTVTSVRLEQRATNLELILSEGGREIWPYTERVEVPFLIDSGAIRWLVQGVACDLVRINARQDLLTGDEQFTLTLVGSHDTASIW